MYLYCKYIVNIMVCYIKSNALSKMKRKFTDSAFPTYSCEGRNAGLRLLFFFYKHYVTTHVP